MPRILRWRFSVVRPSSTPPATPMAPVRTESPIVAAVLPCSSFCDPLLDALVVCSVDSLLPSFRARLREGCRLLVALRRAEPLPLARGVAPDPLLLARLLRPEPDLLLLPRLLRPEPDPLPRLLRPEPLLLARLLRPELPLARPLLPAPLFALSPEASLGEALALELRDAPLAVCLPRLRRADALERSDALDPFAEDDDERLRLLVLLDGERLLVPPVFDVPREVAAAMTTS